MSSDLRIIILPQIYILPFPIREHKSWNWIWLDKSHPIIIARTPLVFRIFSQEKCNTFIKMHITMHWSFRFDCMDNSNPKGGLDTERLLVRWVEFCIVLKSEIWIILEKNFEPDFACLSLKKWIWILLNKLPTKTCLGIKFCHQQPF